MRMGRFLQTVGFTKSSTYYKSSLLSNSKILVLGSYIGIIVVMEA